MQCSVGSGHHIGKCKLRIRKGGLNRVRYESNTTKSSPKIIGKELSSFSSQKVTSYAWPATVGMTCEIKPQQLIGPENNAKVPECGFPSTPVNEVSPVLVQGGKLPVSKPPLTTRPGHPGVPVGVGVGVPPPPPATPMEKSVGWPSLDGGRKVCAKEVAIEERIQVVATWRPHAVGPAGSRVKRTTR